jgi:O-succinylbenzoic acid--CoA ligase
MMALRSIINEWNLTWQTPSSHPDIQSNYDFAAFTSQQCVEIIGSTPSSLNQIKNILLGGGPISEQIIQLANGITSNIWEGYGMTETLTHIAMRDVKVEKYFNPLKGVQFSQGEKGNLVIEDSFLNLPAFATNDIVEFVEERFVVKGRLDHVIISGGVKLFPEEIEGMLSIVIFQPYYISSMPDEVLGQKIVLVVEGDPQDFQLEKINQLNMGIRKPREIIFKPKFNRTASGKIIRES